MTEDTERRALAEVVSAALLFGTTGTARVLGAAGASALGVGAARLIVGGAALVLIASRSGARLPPTIGRGALLLPAALVAVYQLAFFAAIDEAGVAVGTVVTIGSAPPLAGLLGALAGQGRPSRRWGLATLAAIVGIVLLTRPGGAGAPATGVALALVSALGYAGYTVAAKALLDRGAPPIAVMAWAFGLGGLLLVPALLLTSPGWLATGSGTATALYLGLVPTAAAYVLFARGLGRLAAATVTTIVLIEPLVASLLGFAVLGEHVHAAGILGGLLVLAGVGVAAGDKSLRKSREVI